MKEKYINFIKKAEKVLLSSDKKREAPNEILITTMVLLCMLLGYGTLAGMAIISLI